MKADGQGAAPESAVNGSRTGLLFGVIVVAAGILYLHNLGTRSFEANEAYSAWAAAMSGPRAILAIPTLVDPGRELVYYIVLHYFALMFGYGEASLRSLSALLALIAIGLVFLTGREMFGEDTALAATALWAFNPTAVVLSHTARTYTMFVVIAVAQILTLWRVRSRPNRLRVATCGALGGLMLYTHLSALVLLATEIGMLARDWICGRRSLCPWIAIAISLALFAPFLPVFLSLSHTLVHGQWLDWIGTPVHYSLPIKASAIVAGAALGMFFLLGPEHEDDDALEPLRWSAALAILPFAAFLVGSIVIRPLFHVRYLMPSIAMLALTVARSLDLAGKSTRNRLVVALVVVMAAVAPLESTAGPPWVQVASKIVSQGSDAQPVFFEAGFISPLSVPNGGFPQGYYRIPFDYYFHGRNPRMVVPAYDSDVSRKVISQAAQRSGGAWLISWKKGEASRAELPASPAYEVARLIDAHRVILYRIEPASSPVH